MIGDVSGAYAPRRSSLVDVRGRLEIAPLTRQTEPMRFARVIREDLVDGRPREQLGESPCRSATEQMLLAPVSREEFVHGHRREQRGQRGRMAWRVHCLQAACSLSGAPAAMKESRSVIRAPRYDVKCLFGWPAPSLVSEPATILVISARSPYTCKCGFSYGFRSGFCSGRSSAAGICTGFIGSPRHVLAMFCSQ